MYIHDYILHHDISSLVTSSRIKSCRCRCFDIAKAMTPMCSLIPLQRSPKVILSPIRLNMIFLMMMMACFPPPPL